METPEFIIEPLHKRHRRDDFSSGEEALDRFLRTSARQNADKDVSKTYVATHPKASTVLGFYTIRVGQIEFVQLPEKLQRGLPAYPLPVIHLARLAIDHRVQRLGLGRALVADVIARADRHSVEVGIAASEVLAKNEQVAAWYARYGFGPLPGAPLHLILPIAVAREFLR